MTEPNAYDPENPQERVYDPEITNGWYWEDESPDKEIKYANIERLDEAQMLELKNLLLAIKDHFVAYYDEAFGPDAAPVDAFVFWEVTLIQEDLAEMMQRLEAIKDMAPWHAELSGRSPRA